MRISVDIRILLPILFPFFLGACEDQVNNHRIPAMPVDINLANPGMWNVYGVSGVNTYQFFIPDAGLPAGFPYLDKTYTGFGGVLLAGISNNVPDPGSYDAAWPYRPVAFDLSCPVEAEADIIVGIDYTRMEAVCPVCESRYSLEAGGGPVSGPAVGYRYGLQQYRCIGTPMDGFHIVR